MNNVIYQLLDERFSISTISDWIDHRVNKIEKIMGVLSQSISELNDDVENASLDLQTLIQLAYINGIHPDTVLACDDGFTTVRKLFEDVCATITNATLIDSSVLTNKFIRVSNAAGNIVNASFTEFCESINDSKFSAIATKAAILAGDLRGSISDKMVKFQQVIENVLGDISSMPVATLSYFKGLITSDSTGLSIISDVFKSSGVEQFQQGEPFAIKDTDISQYTGSSPMATFSCDSVSSTIEAAGRVAGTAVGAIWGLVKKGASWLWNKATEGVSRIYVNPYDIIDSGDNNSDYTFDNFQYQTELLSPSTGFVYYSFKPGSKPMDLINNRFTQLNNKWIIIKTIGGDIAVKYENLKIAPIMNGQGNVSSVNVTCDSLKLLMKPKSLAIDLSNFNGSLMDIADTVRTRTEGMYYDGNADENTLALSFLSGAIVLWMTLLQFSSDNAITGQFSYSYKPSLTVTNKDVLKIASGYNDHDGFLSPSEATYDRIPLHDVASQIGKIQCSDGTNSYDFSDDFNDWWQLVSKAIFDSVTANLSDDSVYLPFSVQTVGFNKGRFSIKTDEQNHNIAAAITTAVVTVAVIAAVIFVGKAIAKTVLKRIAWKRTEFLGQMDNKIWNSDPENPSTQITAKEKRKYMRYLKKTQIADLCNKGVADAASSSIKTAFDVIGNTERTNAIASFLHDNNMMSDNAYQSITKITGIVDSVSGSGSTSIPTMVQNNAQSLLDLNSRVDKLEKAVQSVSNLIYNPEV